MESWSLKVRKGREGGQDRLDLTMHSVLHSNVTSMCQKIILLIIWFLHLKQLFPLPSHQSLGPTFSAWSSPNTVCASKTVTGFNHCLNLQFQPPSPPGKYHLFFLTYFTCCIWVYIWSVRLNSVELSNLVENTSTSNLERRRDESAACGQLVTALTLE